MNALQHRHLTPFLALACISLSALLVCLLSGWGRTPHWDAPSPPSSSVPKPPISSVPDVTPLAAYAVVWQRSLFTPDRRPTPAVVAQAPSLRLDSLELTGTVLTDLLQVALIRDRASNKDIRIRLRDDYRGWILTTLEPRRAVFSQAGQSQELTLPTVGALTAPSGSGLLPSKPQTFAGTSAPPPQLASATAFEPYAIGGSPPSTATTPVPTSKDDAAVRRALLDALKADVMRRRHHAPTAAKGH